MRGVPASAIIMVSGMNSSTSEISAFMLRTAAFIMMYEMIGTRSSAPLHMNSELLEYCVVIFEECMLINVDR